MEQNSVVNVILYNDFEQILYRSTENLTRRRPRFPFNHLAELGVGKYTHTHRWGPLHYLWFLMVAGRVCESAIEQSAKIDTQL